MKAKLKIRDFSPIRDCELDISKYTMLIGPQGAGKSTIAKVRKKPLTALFY
jgi:predicted ATPase